MERGLDRELLEAALAAHPAVADCAVLERTTVSGALERVAYVVPRLPFDVVDLVRHVENRLPGTLAPIAPLTIVPVTAVPLSPSGDPDDENLARIPVIDAGVVERVEQQAEVICGPQNSMVRIAERRLEAPLLHLEDVLHGYRRSSSSPSSPPADDDRAIPSTDRAGEDGAGSRPSFVDGGPLEIPPGAPATLPEALERAAKEHSDGGIVFLGSDGSETFVSYSDLLTRAESLLSGLRASGFRPGDPILFQLDGRLDFIEAFWAAILGGLIPVPLGVPATYAQPAACQAFENAWRVVGGPKVLTSRERLDEVKDAARGRGLLELEAFDVESLRREPSGEWHEAAPADLALLMLTSGSTGVPKAVRLTHRNLLSRTEASRQRNRFGSADVSVNWMPLDHVAGLVYFHIRDVYLGCRQVQLETGSVLRDPLLWLDALDRFQATLTFAPNFAYGLVNDLEEELEKRRWNLESVRFVLNGAEAIVPKTARKFLRLLARHGLRPGTMHPAWGMSETSSGVTYSDTFSLASSSDDDPFVEVGRPVPGFALRIVDDDDALVEERRVGRLQVRGVVVTDGYFGAPEVTRESFTKDGWFQTGDLGFLREGRLTITGREKEVVVVNSVKYYCHPIEAAVEDVEGVKTSFTAVSAVRDPEGVTDRLAVFFQPDSFDAEFLGDLLPRIASAVRAKAGIAADYLVPLEAADIPKTSLGKIQRSLLSKKLEAGELDSRVKLVDIVSGNDHTVPAWFYRKIWRRKRGKRRDPSADSGRGMAIFLDGEGVGERLEAELASRNWPSVTIAPGTRFERTAALGFRIDPWDPEHYARLVDLLNLEGVPVSAYVHLWGLRRHDSGGSKASELESAQAYGSRSVLHLVRALARRAAKRSVPVRLTVATSGSASVEPGDSVAFERSPVIGLVKSIPQELPWMEATHIDLADLDPDDASRSILDELGLLALDRDVAYRSGERFVACLERALLTKGPTRDAFVSGGFYVMSGGLGGVGEKLARYLAETRNARLLLLGRREPTPEIRGRLSELESAGGEIFYETADVCDDSRTSQLVERYERRFGRRLDGVIHLAGGYRECLLADEDEAGFDAMLRPRLLGTVNLYRLLEMRGGGLFLSSSSVAAFFGGAGIGAYSAAHAALAAFAEGRSRDDGVRVLSLLWSNWDEVGQARETRSKELPRSQGYAPMSVERALRSLQIGIRTGEPALLVGLDSGNRHVRRFVPAEADALQSLEVCCVRGDADRVASSMSSSVPLDRFGIRVQPEVVALSDLPRDESGGLDRERALLLLDRRRHRGARRSPPVTETAIRLASIWKKVLMVSEVGLEDSFFELGGDSLLAARALGEIRDVLGVEVSLRTLFEATTLGELAGFLESAAKASPARASVARGAPLDAEALLQRLDELDDEEVESLLGRMAADDEA